MRALALLLTAWIASLGPSIVHAGGDAPEPRIYQRPFPPAPFTLTDHRGHVFNADALRGRWTILYFGYTGCADACPTTLTAMNGLAKRLAAKPNAEDYAFIFVSVDPYRDTPDRLREHLEFFNPRFVGVTGEIAELQMFTLSLAVPFDYRDRATRKVIRDMRKKPATDDYIVGHASDLFVFNPDGRVAGVIFPPHDPARMARDLDRIRLGK